jgi:aryl-alcohol dehydrogenase-like predicted oxidoreductase
MNGRGVGSFTVAELGLGCMSLSHAYGVPPAPEVAERVLLEAVARGVTLFDTAALYGFGENERLLGRVLRPHRSRIVLSSKGGMAGAPSPAGMKRVIDGRPQAIRQNCEDSLKHLETDVIDLYYLHRVDLKNEVPVEDSVGAIARLIEEGKVRLLGLSEVSVATLKRAHAVHPVAALQSEYSLWTRNPELGTLAACLELGIAFVAFSPLGRGFLTGALCDPGEMEAKDLRRGMPRFAPDTYAKNLQLLEPLARIALEVGCTSGQLALAWLLQRGKHVIPIPGTTSVAHLLDNLAAADVRLTGTQVECLDSLVNQRTVSGARYPSATQAEIDTEDFA